MRVDRVGGCALAHSALRVEQVIKRDHHLQQSTLLRSRRRELGKSHSLKVNASLGRVNLSSKVLKVGNNALAELLGLTDELLAKDLLSAGDGAKMLDDVESVAESLAGAFAAGQNVDDQADVLFGYLWRLKLTLLLGLWLVVLLVVLWRVLGFGRLCVSRRTARCFSRSLLHGNVACSFSRCDFSGFGFVALLLLSLLLGLCLFLFSHEMERMSDTAEQTG